MRRLLLLSLFLITLGFSAGQTPCTQPALPDCSTEKVNDNCRITVDRRYPIQLPTVQVRPRKTVTVCVVRPLAYEALTLDPTGAQAVAGTDQLAGFITSAMGNLKSIGVQSDVFPPPLRSGAPLARTPAQIAAAIPMELDALDQNLKVARSLIDTFVKNAATVYSQLQEILAPLPRSSSGGAPVRAAGLPPATPWDNYENWRTWMLCELRGCTSAPAGIAIDNLLGTGTSIQAGLPAIPAMGAGRVPEFPATSTYVFDETAFNEGVEMVQSDIGTLPTTQQTQFLARLNSIIADEAALRVNLSYYATPIKNVVTDLESYSVYIEQLKGAEVTEVPLGEIADPAASPTNATATKLLGRSISYTVSATNNVGSFVASVPTSAKKSVVTISVLFADPKLEVSAGVFLSMLPSRSFSNQTVITQVPGSVPTTGNVFIAPSSIRPTVLPFVAANWRLGHDRLWLHRRTALYLTTGIALNAYNTSAEYAGGLSLSWRLLMFSALAHLGREIELAQGEYGNEVWCTTANGAKCSPPNPSTTHAWTAAFAFGLSVRVPTSFSANGH